MDMLKACRAFVEVSERGSFTLGAAAAGVNQSVASRRIAALEEHVGGALFDRSTRRPTLTPFGRDLLPSAKRLVDSADDLEFEAEAARLGPLRMVVPETCGAGDLARLAAAARAVDIVLDIRSAPPTARARQVLAQEVRVALIADAPQDATWIIPLGLAGAAPADGAAIFLDSLRARRSRAAVRRRVWLQPEDDVPSIRDRMVRMSNSVGLQPAQLATAGTLISVAAAVLASDDLLLCSRRQAAQFGLHWRPIGELHLVRGYDAAAGSPADAERMRSELWAPIAACLGGETAVPQR